MSLSDAHESGQSSWGTIFAGGREHSLGGIEHAKSTAWTPEDEANYLERVREKARQMAAGILAEARNEAERLKNEAMQQGYDAGIAHAEQEIESFRSGMAESVSAVLNAIEGQCSHIFDQWREDITAVARLAVERMAAVELSENRQQALTNLLSESIAMLEKRRELVIRVNPEDEPMLTDIVGLTRERFPDVGVWRVRADASISPGGMVVESESSLADGKVESRAAAVMDVLHRLVLPSEPVGEPMPETTNREQPKQTATRPQSTDIMDAPVPDPLSAGSPEPGVLPDES